MIIIRVLVKTFGMVAMVACPFAAVVSEGVPTSITCDREECSPTDAEADATIRPRRPTLVRRRPIVGRDNYGGRDLSLSLSLNRHECVWAFGCLYICVAALHILCMS